MSQAQDRFLELVRCLAVAPKLQGTLFLDLDPALLQAAGHWLADCIEANHGRRPRVVTLGSWHTDDDLWTNMRLTETGLETVPGLLVEMEAEPPPVFLVPDLATASLSVRRAVVTTAGADAASSQRHGFSEVWHPRARWLAAARRDAVATMSAHLLDRFPIRCDGADVRGPERANALDEDPAGWLRAALGTVPIEKAASFGPRGLERVAELSSEAPGMRRDIAFARLSRAVAVRRGSSTVSVPDVDRAAALLGMLNEASPEPEPKHLTASPEVRGPALSEPHDGEPERDGPELEETLEHEPVSATSGNGPEVLGDIEHASSAMTEGFFPEDDNQILAEPMALREWWHRRASGQDHRGQIIGTQRTRSLRDFAVIATLLEAHKFKAIRPGRGRKLVIAHGDLRRFRRRPEPTAAMVLILDHSCHRGWDWSPALASYLRWAYITRALVCVIEFGYRGAPNELRADRYRARSLLDPRIAVSLSRDPGRASPLAHAVDLAADELRHLLRRRHTPVHEALLLVVTDARGNVPFSDSAGGRISSVVGRRGVTDALEAAKATAELRGLRAVVLTPDVAPYPQLPFELADALGAIVTSPLPRAPSGRLR